MVTVVTIVPTAPPDEREKNLVPDEFDETLTATAVPAVTGLPNWSCSWIW